MFRRTTLVSAAAAALVLVPTAAMAYDAPGYSSAVTDATPTAGAPITVAVNGATAIAGKTVLLTVTSTPASLPNDAIQIAGTATASKVADAAGDVKFSVTLREAGSYSAVATVDGAAVSTMDLAVAARTSGASTTTEALSDTGFDGAGLAAGAGALVVAGAGAVLIAKRRQTSAI